MLLTYSLNLKVYKKRVTCESPNMHQIHDDQQRRCQGCVCMDTMVLSNPPSMYDNALHGHTKDEICFSACCIYNIKSRL